MNKRYQSSSLNIIIISRRRGLPRIVSIRESSTYEPGESDGTVEGVVNRLKLLEHNCSKSSSSSSKWNEPNQIRQNDQTSSACVSLLLFTCLIRASGLLLLSLLLYIYIYIWID